MRGHRTWTNLCLGAILLGLSVLALGCGGGGGGTSSGSPALQTQQVKHSGVVTLTIQ
jgi:hypothetical protein